VQFCLQYLGRVIVILCVDLRTRIPNLLYQLASNKE
jgi:hypothetical protein